MSGQRSILAKILAVKETEVAAAKAARPASELERMCRDVDPPRSLRQALVRPPGGAVRVISEIKRASPSAGPIRPGADPVAIARAYAEAGAAAISVLTDEQFFDGRLAFLGQVRPAVSVPLLRKDFVIDAYQVTEARAAGADAVLLIVAAMADGSEGDAHLAALLAEARRHGMDALVEVHSEAEAERALAAGADIVGVNHRDLRTFAMDMSLTGRLRAQVPADVVLVGESGIHGPADVRVLGQAGADAVLVGEHLMRAPSPGAALAELVGIRPDGSDAQAGEEP